MTFNIAFKINNYISRLYIKAIDLQYEIRLKFLKFALSKNDPKHKKQLEIEVIALLNKTNSRGILKSISNSEIQINPISLKSKNNKIIFPDTQAILPQRFDSLSSLKFAVDHSLHIFKENSIYTFIPKNACSSIRYSIALSNGFISGTQDFNWIHKNNKTLSVKNINSLLNPNYSFVILRCPYSRIVSVFFDKFVKGMPVALDFMSFFFHKTKIEDISFQDFVNRICELRREQLDHHWRPQVDFLIYEKYDRYFSMENFPEISITLANDINFIVQDVRKIAQHHTSEDRNLINLGNPWNYKIKELREISTSGFPATMNMFNRELIDKTKKIYAEDIELYIEKFGKNGLTF